LFSLAFVAIHSGICAHMMFHAVFMRVHPIQHFKSPPLGSPSRFFIELDKPSCLAHDGFMSLSPYQQKQKTKQEDVLREKMRGGFTEPVRPEPTPEQKAQWKREEQQREQEYLKGHDSDVRYILTRKGEAKPCYLINRRYNEMAETFIESFMDGTVDLDKKESDKKFHARLDNVVCRALETLGWTQVLSHQYEYEFRKSYDAVRDVVLKCDRAAKQRKRMLKAKQAITAGQSMEQFMSSLPKKIAEFERRDYRTAYSDAISEAKNG
jgi:hypothetical protein